MLTHKVWQPVEFLEQIGPDGEGVIVSTMMKNGHLLYRIELPDGRTTITAGNKDLTYRIVSMINSGEIEVGYESET